VSDGKGGKEKIEKKEIESLETTPSGGKKSVIRNVETGNLRVKESRRT